MKLVEKIFLDILNELKTQLLSQLGIKPQSRLSSSIEFDIATKKIKVRNRREK